MQELSKNCVKWSIYDDKKGQKSLKKAKSAKGVYV